MEMIARSELALAQVAGGTSKGSSTSNSSSSNSVVILTQGDAGGNVNIKLPGLSIR